MDRTTVKMLRDYVDENLNIPGFRVEIGTGRYNAHEVTFPITLVQLNEDGSQPLSKEARTFQQVATNYGLSPDDLFKEFKCKGKRYQLNGAIPRRRKFPFTALSLDDGKTWKFSKMAIQKALGRGVYAKAETA